MMSPNGRADPLINEVTSQHRFTDRRWLSAAFFVAVLVAVNLVFFRLQILNGFSVLFSDRNDGVIEDAILEHWYNVIRGLAAWSEVNYFYPHDKTLGYTDGFFLFGLLHAIFRSFGLDPLLSSELVNVVVKNIGFAAFFVASRRTLGLSFGWALFGAALFTLSHSSFLQAGHAQLLSVSFVPLMVVLIWESYDALRASRRLKLLIVGCLAGVFFAAWLLTAFYMAWFFAFFGVFLLATLLVMGGKPALDMLKLAMRDNRKPLLIIGAVTAASLVPFLIVYLPKSNETGMRAFGQVLGSTLAIKDIVNVGADNFMFGRLYTAAVKALCPACDVGFGELTTGITPLLLVLLGCCVAWLWRAERSPDGRALLRGIALATLITWVLCLHVRNISGWYLVYHLFPGAKGLRVVSRYQIFLMAPIVALVVCYLAALAQRISRPIIIALCALLLLGELDSGASETVALERGPENERIAASAPPRECHSFFVSSARDQDSSSLVNAVYPHNVDAMMIAELVNLPTINGFASFNPPGWDLAYPNNADYLGRIEKYAAQHKLTGLCRLDLTTMLWQVNWRTE
jgi:hypothetical protein